MKLSNKYFCISTLFTIVIFTFSTIIVMGKCYMNLNDINAQKVQKVKRLKAQVVESYTHDKTSYTQGLFFHSGKLYESAGQYGESSFRQVDLKTGKVLKRFDLEKKYFAEGACVFNNRLYLLTWKERVCFVYDIDTFKYLGELKYNGEGWGLSTNGKELIMSNGTADIIFLDPATFTQTRKITVKINDKAVYFLNELEYINGEIWANVYGEDDIITINPNTGAVTSIIDCQSLYPISSRSPLADVLNGIAFNPLDGKIYLTGKYWPKMYNINLISK